MSLPLPLLEVIELSAPSFNGTELFANVSLTLATREVLVLRAVSGTGKSILLKCIANLLVPSQGKVLFKGKTASEIGVPNFRAAVTYVPQRPPLLSGTPAQFEKSVRSLKAQRSRMHRKQASDVLSEWKMDLSLLERDWNLLSGGEAQRCALAIALALEPEILLLDEPTSALDAEATRLVEETILGQDSSKNKRTCIWITHDSLQAERVADRIYDLKRNAGRNQDV